MKFKLFVLLLLVAMVATPVFAQMGSDTSAPAQDPAAQTQDEGLQSAPVSTTTGSTDPGAAASGESEPAGLAADLVEATVSSIDSTTGELKVNDLSGAERTYQVSNIQSLQDIKAGDQVKITPDPNDPSKAQMVEKNQEEMNKGFAL